MSQPEWEAISQHIQASKARITFTDDTQSAATAAMTPALYHPGDGHLVRAQYTTTGTFASAGYTTYTVLDTDGSRWYQTVYLYGTSNGQWTCQWNQYQGMWEPPGCPAYHDFYTSNRINGQGYTNNYKGTAWNPAQYMNIGLEFDTPVGRNDGSETVYSDATVICSLAGVLMGASLDQIQLLVRFGTTYEQWDGYVGKTVGGGPICYVFPACRNPKPYIVDLPYVILLQLLPGYTNTTCSAGFTCLGICVRAAPGYPWPCTGNTPQAAACARLPEGVPNPPQTCTPRP